LPKKNRTGYTQIDELFGEGQDTMVSWPSTLFSLPCCYVIGVLLTSSVQQHYLVEVSAFEHEFARLVCAHPPDNVAVPHHQIECKGFDLKDQAMPLFTHHILFFEQSFFTQKCGMAPLL